MDIDDFDEEDGEYDGEVEITRDDLTDDMFGEAEPVPPIKDWSKTQKPPSKDSYLVLARKYRPQNFKDLVGQDAMVRTLTNAFEQNRIAHAFILTGVRGIGKTTTARLIARALNYSSPGHDGPTTNLEIEGIHCEAITQGRHPDVLELDAASNTQVDKMRDILDNSRYGPIEARYKIYIIDEVHMLSMHSFNALLKTLEEPPPYLKFIFATTETQKVPVTILSRCQRFDLRRLDNEAMVNHLENICAKENVKVEKDGLLHIARAAEGSVRDALSLLDQAIVQTIDDAPISAIQVRNMLGLADRNRVKALFSHILKGDTKSAFIEVREQYDYGATPINIIQSLMEICHEATKYQIMGEAFRKLETEEGFKAVSEIAGLGSKMVFARLWQMMLKGFEEVKTAPEPMAALEMCIVRLCGSANVPPPEDLIRIVEGQIQSNNSATTIAPTPSSAPVAQLTEKAVFSFNSFEEMLELLEHELGERALVSRLERFARPVRLEDCVFTFEPTKDCPKNLNLQVSAALSELTGKHWRVYIEENGGQTIEEKRKIHNDSLQNQALQDEKVQSVMKHFKGAKILAVREKEVKKQISN